MFSFLVLYILADLTSFLEIQRLQLAAFSSTVFAVNLFLEHRLVAIQDLNFNPRIVSIFL